MSLLFVFDVILGITSLVGFLTAYVIWHIKILDEK
jgi:hypothetical protein